MREPIVAIRAWLAGERAPAAHYVREPDAAYLRFTALRAPGDADLSRGHAPRHAAPGG